jgi:quinol monooxygenase YgiN
MYTIIGTVTARPETREELATSADAEQVAPTRAEAGCINYDFHVDAADPCVFVFYENWTDRAALDAHLAMPHLQAALLAA